MGKYCYCPTSFNVASGVFMMILAIFSFFKIWDISMPEWLAIIMLLIGFMLVFLNWLNPVHEKIDELSTEKANKLHSREGY